MLGREEEAQEAYREAVEASQGVSPGSYAKALTALNEYTAGEFAAMEEAASYLKLSEGEMQSGGVYLPKRCLELLSMPVVGAHATVL